MEGLLLLNCYAREEILQTTKYWKQNRVALHVSMQINFLQSPRHEIVMYLSKIMYIQCSDSQMSVSLHGKFSCKDVTLPFPCSGGRGLREAKKTRDLHGTPKC